MNENEEYFNELNMMFASDGWKTFKKEIEATLVNLNNVNDIKDANELFFRKGQIAMLMNVAGFENQVAAAQVDNEGSE